MLMSLGGVTFEIAPINTHAYDQSAGASFVEKPVMGSRPPLEFTGPGGEDFQISGKMFPEKFGGSLADFQTMRQAGKALPLTRGDGAVLGWFVIDKVSSKSEYLRHDGVPRVLSFALSLKRSDAPSAGSYFSIISGLFG